MLIKSAGVYHWVIDIRGRVDLTIGSRSTILARRRRAGLNGVGGQASVGSGIATTILAVVVIASVIVVVVASVVVVVVVVIAAVSVSTIESVLPLVQR